MGFLSASLAIVTVGYIFGVWTGCAIFSRRGQGHHNASMRLPTLSAPAIAEVTLAFRPRI